MENALELAFRRDDLKLRIKELADASNSWYGKGSSLYDVMSSVSKEIKEVEDELRKR